jgi:ABC-2 type transport system ATP-binding protein
MISVNRLNFEYPGVRALKDVSFSIKPGSITALVGPNGAGKSTLLRCLAALDHPISGAIKVDGIDVLENPRDCHRKVGYLSDFFGLYDDLTVRQCLTYATMAHGLAPQIQERAIMDAAFRLEISDRLESKAGSLSRGLRQRLAIAQSIIHNPKILLLDEPASGLDPEARNSLSKLFLELRDHGMTLLVSSHILTELEEYSTNLIILRNGELIEHCTGCSQNYAAVPMRISLASEYDGLYETLKGINGITDINIHVASASFKFRGDAAAQHLLLKALIDRGMPIKAFTEEKINFHATYFATSKNDRLQDEDFL